MERKDLTEIFSEVNRRNPFAALNHIRVEHVEPDLAETSLHIASDSLNPHALVHGGALFTLMDCAAGTAASTDGRIWVTQSADVHFLRAAAAGVVRAEAHIRHRGRSTALAEVCARSEEEKLLSSASFTLFCVNGSSIERNSPVAADARSLRESDGSCLAARREGPEKACAE